MAKKSVNIKFQADTKEAKNGIQELTSSLNSFSKKVKSSDVTKLSVAFMGATKAASLAVNGIKSVSNSVKELQEAYKNQITAERQLEVAAKNNPYLNSSSVRQLEDFASHLQSISTVGDEELLPLMAQLAAAGRTQSEIQDIMSAALDVSASGAMSLEGAVKNLNKTFSGLSGELGETVPAIKALTKEQLQHGEAVKVLAAQYKGMAEETARATGSSEQLKNVIGDVKEEMGAVFESAGVPMRRFFTEAFSNLSSYLSQLRKTREDSYAVLSALDRASAGNASLEDWQVIESGTEQLINKNLDKIEELQAKFDALSSRKQNGKAGKDLLSQIEELESQNDRFMTTVEASNENIYTKQKEAFQKLIEEAASAESVAAKKSILVQAQAYETILTKGQDYKRGIIEIQQDISNSEAIEQEKAAIAAQQAYEQKIQNYKDELAKRKELGEAISEESEIMGEISIRQSGLLELVSKYQALGWDTKDIEEYSAEIQKLYDLVKDGSADSTSRTVEGIQNEAQALISKATSFVGGDSESKLSDQIAIAITALESYMEALDETGDAYQQLTTKKNELAALQTEVEKKELAEQAQAAKETAASIVEDVASYIDKFAEITNGITDLVRQNNEEETDEAQTNLAQQYTDGLISYEEYCEKKAQLDKKAAQEEYKLKMWEWSASLLTATANVAQGIAKALAEGGPYAGPILAALIGASGAIQIATITANKPQSPSFATGGIVQGSSYSGDNVQANVNSGEMILNAQQQKNLWEMANGRSSSGAVVNMPVTIENNASDSVNASAGLSPEGLTVVINKIVNSQMALGKYNQSMDIANSRRQGVEYQ